MIQILAPTTRPNPSLKPTRYGLRPSHAAELKLHGLPQVKPPLSLRDPDTDCGSTFGLCVSSIALARMMLRVERMPDSLDGLIRPLS